MNPSGSRIRNARVPHGVSSGSARYADFSGGCPSSNSGGTAVSVELVSLTTASRSYRQTRCVTTAIRPGRTSTVPRDRAPAPSRSSSRS